MFITINGGRYTLNLANIDYIDWAGGDHGILYPLNYDPYHRPDREYFLDQDDVANVRKAVGME